MYVVVTEITAVWDSFQYLTRLKKLTVVEFSTRKGLEWSYAIQDSGLIYCLINKLNGVTYRRCAVAEFHRSRHNSLGATLRTLRQIAQPPPELKPYLPAVLVSKKMSQKLMILQTAW